MANPPKTVKHSEETGTQQVIVPHIPLDLSDYPTLGEMRDAHLLFFESATPEGLSLHELLLGFGSGNADDRKRLDRAYTAFKWFALDPVRRLRNRLREQKLGGWDSAALLQAADWLIDKHHMTVEQAWAVRLDRLLILLSGGAEKKRWSITETNEKAKELARKMKKGFFAMSETAQADLIGCHLRTWRRTPFYKTARKQRGSKPHHVGESTGTRPALPLTEEILATTEQGEPNGVLNQLMQEEEAEKKRKAKLQAIMEEQARDYELSPLEDDPPDQKRKGPKHHKKL